MAKQGECFPNSISIHAPPRGATRFPMMQHLGSVFQFTPLREGRRDAAEIRRKLYISIHAPPRGATASALCCVGGDVFQFTPLREGRQKRQAETVEWLYFNSRPSARGDPGIGSFVVGEEISIHAPPRGATRIVDGFILVNKFQFTPLREGRPGG